MTAAVPQGKIKTHVELLTQRSDLVAELVKAPAKMIVGRSSYTDYSWIKEQFHTHISEQLIANSDNVAICMVK